SCASARPRCPSPTRVISSRPPCPSRSRSSPRSATWCRAVFEYAMPSLGADMESGTLLAWYVKPGDVVVRGQIVGLVDTEKAEIEIEIWTPGRVERVL